MSGILYLIGSPIGNSLDISDRLISAVETAEFICVEDIERFVSFCNINNLHCSAELLDIMYSPDVDRELESLEYVAQKINSGTDVYVISDEGMPGIADPGNLIMDYAIKNNIVINVSPGPSTILGAAALAGVLNRFSFEGFLPHDNDKRNEYWKYLSTLNHPMIFLLQNPENMPVDTELKTYASNQASNTFVFLNEAIENLGNRQAMYALDITTDKQVVIRKTMKELLSTLLEQNIPGNACIVVSGKDHSLAIPK